MFVHSNFIWYVQTSLILEIKKKIFLPYVFSCHKMMILYLMEKQNKNNSDLFSKKKLQKKISNVNDFFENLHNKIFALFFSFHQLKFFPGVSFQFNVMMVSNYNNQSIFLWQTKWEITKDFFLTKQQQQHNSYSRRLY